MKKARAVKQKVMGRPRTGITPLIGFRADAATRASIVKWAKNEADQPSLSEAIRRLVELGLSVARSRPASRARAGKAHEMAGKQLDQLADQSATAEEQASRKRRLLKGPEEFRGVRVDRPGAKK
jgi:hypothetical protein